MRRNYNIILYYFVYNFTRFVDFVNSDDITIRSRFSGYNFRIILFGLGKILKYLSLGRVYNEKIKRVLMSFKSKFRYLYLPLLFLMTAR